MHHAHSRDDHRLVRFARQPDPDLRRQLVERYMPLARFAAAAFAKGSEPFDDLLQVASIGLLKAIDRFDPGNGAAFSSYALPTMNGELRRHFRDRSWAVRPPRDLQEQALLVERATSDLQGRWRRAPTVEEVADHVELAESTVLEAREALAARHASSLSQDADPDGGAGEIDRRHGTIDEGYGQVEHRATLDALTSRALTRRERQVIRLRFEHDLTQSEIGTIIGLSQMHVSRVLRCAIDKLRRAAGDGEAVAA
jgi:RNA polymerase sigma-B factor